MSKPIWQAYNDVGVLAMRVRRTPCIERTTATAVMAATVFNAIGQDLVEALTVQLTAALDEIARPDDDGQR